MEFIREKDLWTDKFFENAGWTQDEDGAWSGAVADLYRLYGRDTGGFFGVNMNMTQPVVISFTAKYDRISESYNYGMNLRFQYMDGTVSSAIVNTTTYSAYKLVSTAGKVIDKITCSYGTGVNTTYFKDVKIQVIGEINEVVDTPKNIIPFPYYYMTVDRPSANGITLTTSDNGYITANGSATKTTTFLLAYGDFKVLNRVRLQCFSSSKKIGVAIQFYNDTTLIDGHIVFGTDFVDIDTPDASTYNRINIYLAFLTGETFTNTSANAVLSEVQEIAEWSPPSQPQSYSPYIIRNLLTLPYAIGETITVYGVTATVDKSTGQVSLSGTYAHTGYADFALKKAISLLSLQKGTYYLTGCPNGGGTYTYRILGQITRADKTVNYFNDTGDGSSFVVNDGDKVDYVYIRIGADFGTHENLVFKPLLIKLPEEV